MTIDHRFRKVRHLRKHERRVEALERQDERNKRGDLGQLRRLESLGFTKCREFSKLKKIIETDEKKKKK